MNMCLLLLLALAGGLAAGFVFFQGLWLTVKRLPSARHPALLLLASLFARSALAVGIIWAATMAEPGRVLASLLGFISVRAVLTRRHGRVPTLDGKEAAES